MLRHLEVIFKTHWFFSLGKILIIKFCRSPIFMQLRCEVFATDGSQIVSLIMDTLYIYILFNLSNCL